MVAKSATAKPLGMGGPRRASASRADDGIATTRADGTVYVVEDDGDARIALVEALEKFDLTVVAFADAAGLLVAPALARPACIVMDLRLPRMSGIEALETLRERGINIPAIVISGYGNVDTAVRAMKAGAADFVEKPVRPRHLLSMIRSCLERDFLSSRADINREELRQRVATLTAREHQVMALVVAGASNKHVARALDVSPRTVEHHRARVMRKIGARSLAELVHFASILERTDGRTTVAS